MRYEEFLNEVIDSYADRGLLFPEEMPDVDLYMDQLVSLLNRHLEVYKEKKQDVFTKAMVSNYVKHKILPKPENKKYNREHMILLNIIFQLKNVFQMEEMKHLFKPFVENYESVLDEKYDLEGIYNDLILNHEKKVSKLSEQVQKEVESIKQIMEDVGDADDDSLEIMGVILALSIQSNVNRLIARKLFMEYFNEEKKKK